MELVTGQLVQSRQGRDVGRWYAVAGFEGAGSGARVLCANGHKWTLNAPKRKNPLHLQPAKTQLQPAQMENDLKLKAALKAFEQSLGQAEQGG